MHCKQGGDKLCWQSSDGTGAEAYSAGIQMQGVLDEGFYYDGPLGASEGGGGTHFGLWAPTAQSVELLFFDGPEGAPAESQPMSKGPAGSWTFQVMVRAFPAGVSDVAHQSF